LFPSLSCLSEGFPGSGPRGVRRYVLAAWLALFCACGQAAAEPSREQTPLIVSQDHAWPPFAFLDAKGEPQGLLIDIWREVGTRLGRPVEFRLVDWGRSIEQVRDGEADIHGGLLKSAERAAFLDFSDKIVPLSAFLFVRGDSLAGSVQELGDTTVGVIASSYELEFMRSRYPDIPLSVFNNNEQMILAATAGDLHAFAADYPVALYLLDRHARPGLFRPLQELYAMELVAAVALDDGGLLLGAVNQVLRDLDSEDLRRLMQRWIRSDTVEVQVLPAWLVPGGLSVLMLFGFTLHSIMQFRQRRRLASLVDSRTAELRESEALFRALSDHAQAAVFIVDDMNFVAINPAMEQLLGEPRETIFGKAFLDYVHPDDRQLVSTRGKARTRGEDVPNQYEMRVINASGETRWVDLTADMVEFRGRRVRVGTLFDITERKRIEQEQQSQHAYQALIAEISQRFVKADMEHLDATMDFMLKAMGTFLGVQRSYLFTLSEDGKILHNTHEWCEQGFPSVLGECRHLPLESMPWFAQRMRNMASGQGLIIIDDVSALPPDAATDQAFLQSQQVGGLMCVPLQSGERMTGFFGFDASTPRHWEDDRPELLLMLAGLLSKVMEKHQLEQDLRDLSVTDPLTGLHNRRFLFNRLESLVQEHRRNNTLFAVAMLDLDHFKALNDEHGHMAGDAVLKMVADCLNGGHRSIDVASRYGGEEFALLLMGADTDGAKRVVERLLLDIAALQCPWNGQMLGITVSAGVADVREFHDDALSGTALLELADARLYEAKRQGRRRVVGG